VNAHCANLEHCDALLGSARASRAAIGALANRWEYGNFETHGTPPAEFSIVTVKLFSYDQPSRIQRILTTKTQQEEIYARREDW
jgi:hypothetical protein